MLCTFGKFYAHLVYFMHIWYIVCTYDIFYANLVYFMQIWYILCTFGNFFTLYEEKCGNPSSVSLWIMTTGANPTTFESTYKYTASAGVG
jgi:hypothetical protein